MIIFFGSRTAHLASVQPETTKCPSCGTENALSLSLFSKHAHLYWIPMFPIGKKGVLHCHHCQYTAETSEMPDSVKREYDHMKSDIKAPFWQYSGLAIIAAFMLFTSIAASMDKQNDSRYLASPITGDVYKYETESGNYSTIKVVEVSSDSVYFAPNEYEFTKKSGVDEIDREENYADYYYSMSLEELKAMYDRGDIYGVIRD